MVGRSAALAAFLVFAASLPASAADLPGRTGAQGTAPGAPDTAPGASLAPGAGGDPGADPGNLAAAAPADPCSGPGAADSVYCWGPWSALSPAAGGPTAPAIASDLLGTPQRPELADDFDRGVVASVGPDTMVPPGGPPAPPIEPPGLDLPLGACAPGEGCGFATNVDNPRSTDTPANTGFAPIDLADDGTRFTVTPDGAAPIDSVDLTATTLPRDDGYENLQAVGAAGDLRSRLVARVLRRDTGDIEVAADIWGSGNAATGEASSGLFAWGRALTQADLDTLNAGARQLTFTGPMSVDNRTVGTLTVDFGASAGWSGEWVNPDYRFSAGGGVAGVNFASQADRFSENVNGGVVQGALIGTAANPFVTHIVDVDLAGQGLVRDVGLLRGPATTPGTQPVGGAP